jgi:hypothetical protein
MDEAGKSGRGRCEEHDLARGPDGHCVLCRRDNAPPAPRSKTHRALVLVGVLTTLFGGAAFARGVVASRAARATPPAVFESRESPPAPHDPPVSVAPKPHEPVATPVPSVTTNNRLDDALATIPPPHPEVKPQPRPEVVETPVAEAPCVCRPRVQHQNPQHPYNAWGPDHDSEGHLHTKSRLHASWGPPLSFNEPSHCSCPRGTVRVRPHAPAQNGSTTDHISPE